MRYFTKRTLCLSLFLMNGFTLAANQQTFKEMHIINHFNDNLSFKITINPNVLSDLPQTFTLERESSIQTKVLDIKKEAYIALQDSLNNKGFWGVEIDESKLKFHGYISKGIAFSWKNDIIIFCTPEDYKKNHSCF